MILQHFLSGKGRMGMKFRPCIDIHNGKVKQIVGDSLKDQGNLAQTNFTSSQNADWYAKKYREDGLKGGHIILLNSKESEYFEETKKQAMEALLAYPGGMQIGGGITAENAAEYLDAGASHVIVTSYVFHNGGVDRERLKRLKEVVGKKRIVLDLSCRKKEEDYYIVTDRWQSFTREVLSPALLDEMAQYCDEFLVHGVDVEGKASGVEVPLVELLGQWDGIPVTYAGGIGSLKDLERFKELGRDKLDFTIGSALDLFGGAIPYEMLLGL